MSLVSPEPRPHPSAEPPPWASRARACLRVAARTTRRRGTPRFVSIALLSGGSLLPIGPLCSQARADTSVELSTGAGFGALVAGVTSGRFSVSPSASLSLRGERWFFVARDTTSFLGLAGGPFGIDNETTLGGGLFGRLVNVSAGLSLAEFWLPLCGAQFCGKVHGLAPGASVRLDVFGPFLSDRVGVSIDCAGSWITGRAAPVWSGVSVRCSLGPVLRFAFQP